MNVARAPLAGQQLLDLLPDTKSQDDLFERFVQVAETGRPHEIELVYDADGIQGWFRNMTVKLGDGIAVSFFDITERKHNEEKLGYQAFLLDVGTEQPGTGPVRLCRVPRSQGALARHLAVGGVDHE